MFRTISKVVVFASLMAFSMSALAVEVRDTAGRRNKQIPQDVAISMAKKVQHNSYKPLFTPTNKVASVQPTKGSFRVVDMERGIALTISKAGLVKEGAGSYNKGTGALSTFGGKLLTKQLPAGALTGQMIDSGSYKRLK